MANRLLEGEIITPNGWIFNTITGKSRRMDDDTSPASAPTARMDSNNMQHDPKTIAHLDALAKLGVPGTTITGNGQPLSARNATYIEAYATAVARQRTDADKFATVPREREDGNVLHWDANTGELIGVENFRTDESKRCDEARAAAIHANRNAWNKDDPEAMKLHQDRMDVSRRMGAARTDAPTTDVDLEPTESGEDRAKRLRAAAGTVK